jgi:hypothetical protein
MSERVSQSRATPIFWLAAGTSVAAIGVLGTIVFFVQKPADSGSMPLSAARPTRVQLTNIASPSAFNQKLDVHVAAPHKPQAHQLPIDQSQPPYQTVATRAPGSATTQAAVVLADAKSASNKGLASVASPVPQLASPTTPAPVSQPRLRSEEAAPPVPVATKPALPPATAPRQVPARTQDVETVVVRASANQQMALNIDTIGRGNSVVIQLPRAPKPNSPRR